MNRFSLAFRPGAAVAVATALAVAVVPMVIGPRLAGAAAAQSDQRPASTADVDDVGGLSGMIEAPADTENLCVVATSADGVSPAVRTATFAVAGVEGAQFSIGAFAGRGLPEGEWNLRGLPCDGGTTAPPTPRFALDGVRVEGGEVTAGLSLAPTKAASSIKGTVVDGDQKPVAGACVTASGEGGGAGAAPTGERGEYQLTGLALGTYQVLAVGCADDETAALRGSAVDDDGAARSVKLTADGAEGVTVAMRPGRKVGGRLIDEQGGALSGVCLVAGDRNARTDAGGEFELVGVAADVDSLAVSTCGDGRGVIADRLKLPDGRDPVKLDDQVITRAGVVEGTVTNGAGLPMSGVVVAARTETKGPDLTSTVTSATGEYRLVGVPPGDYVMVINPDAADDLPTAWSGEKGLVGSADSAGRLSVDIDAPTRLSGSLGKAPKTSDLAVSTTPDKGAFITIDGIRRADGAATVALEPGNHVVSYGDVGGWITPGNDAVKITGGDGDRDKVVGKYTGPLVNILGEVPRDSVPLSINGREIGTGKVSLAVPEDQVVQVCADACLPNARAGDVAGRVLRPPPAKAPDGPGVDILAIGANGLLTTVIELDGEPRSFGRVTLPATAGQHEIVFGDSPGYLTPLPHRVDLDANVTVPVVANYESLAPFSIDAGSDDGSIWVDGVSVGAGRISIGLRPGTRVVCAAPDDKARCTPVVASAGEPQQLGADRFGG